MRLLLDTHVLMWWFSDSRSLKAEARSAIASADVVWVSAVSALEVSIKARLGKLHAEGPVEAMARRAGFDELAVTLRHADHVRLLPPYHEDPFDRLLVAQALVEGATLVTHDRQLARYDVPVIWT
ncbi:MAG: type II toxin-antitoxin system VapC family toxin [Vicinamibacterales bacterium]